MAQWIEKDDYLNQQEMENNAAIIVEYYRAAGVNDSTIAAMLGNMQIESTLSPILNERGGGGGYGLVQWTPKSSLIEHCDILKLSPYNSGDVQIIVIQNEILGTPASVNEWYTTQAFISPYYSSGATADMVGVTGQEFLSNSMGWECEKLAVLFMAGYERPAYEGNFYQERQQHAREWFNWMGGISPGKKPIPSWDAPAMIQWGAIVETIRRRFYS